VPFLLVCICALGQRVMSRKIATAIPLICKENNGIRGCCGASNYPRVQAGPPRKCVMRQRPRMPKQQL